MFDVIVTPSMTNGDGETVRVLAVNVAVKFVVPTAMMGWAGSGSIRVTENGKGRQDARESLAAMMMLSAAGAALALIDTTPVAVSKEAAEIVCHVATASPDKGTVEVVRAILVALG